MDTNTSNDHATPDFKSILDMGSERVVADLVVNVLESDPGFFRSLLDLCFLEQYPLSMRAARAAQLYCEKHPEEIYPFIDKVVDKTIQSNIKGVRHNFLKIFAEFIDIEKITDPGPLLNTCFEWLLDARLTPAVRVYSIGVIYKLGLKEPELLHELEATIELLMVEAEPSLRSYGRRMLKRIVSSHQSAACPEELATRDQQSAINIRIVPNLKLKT
jgi:hypothetical protein